MKRSILIITMIMFVVNSHAKDMYGGVELVKYHYEKTMYDTNLKYSSINPYIFIGKRFDNFAIEGGWTHILKDSIGNLDGVDAKLKGNIMNISGLYYFANNTKFNPFIKVGLNYWDLTLYASGDGLTVGFTDDGIDPSYGIGADITTDYFKTRISYNNIKTKGSANENLFDSNLNGLGIALIFDF